MTEENSLETFDGFIPTSTVLGLSWSLFVVSLFFSITTCVLCCCACCSHRRDHHHSDDPVLSSGGTIQFKRYGVQSKHFALASAALVLVFASIMSGAYTTARRVLDKQDYKGLMRITGWSYSDMFSHEFENHNEQTYYKHYVEADLTLDWGYTWACPNHDNKSCTNSGSKSISKCKTLICQTHKENSECSEEEVDEGMSQVAQCANNLFDPSLAENGYYVPYDENEGPSNDVNWPSIIGYGDCNRCTARENAPSIDALRSLRISAIFFLVVAFGAVGGASVCWARETQKMEKLSNQPTVPICEVPTYNPHTNTPQQNPIVNTYYSSGATYGMWEPPNSAPPNVYPVTGDQTTAGDHNTHIVNRSNTVPIANGQLVEPVEAAPSLPIVYAEPMPKALDV